MTLEETIKYMEEVAKKNDDSAKEFYRVSKLETHPDRKIAEDGYVECKKCADEHRQLAEWLKILKSAKFEYDEAWRTITHPTPDVTYADKQRAQVILDKFRNSLGAISALQAQDVPDINVGDMVSRQKAIDIVVFECGRWTGLAKEISKQIKQLPSAQLEPSQVARDIATIIENEKDMRVMLSQSEWDNHTVACLLAELFDDPCACNYNGIDEWLPEKCEVIDACPNPVGVACWEQYLKHRAERRTDELGDK